jgi:hypothetical protein
MIIPHKWKNKIDVPNHQPGLVVGLLPGCFMTGVGYCLEDSCGMGSIIGSTVLSEPRATAKAHGVDHVYFYCLLKLPSNEYNIV